jgi:Ankyrin repeats (3 copies)
MTPTHDITDLAHSLDGITLASAEPPLGAELLATKSLTERSLFSGDGSLCNTFAGTVERHYSTEELAMLNFVDMPRLMMFCDTSNVSVLSGLSGLSGLTITCPSRQSSSGSDIANKRSKLGVTSRRKPASGLSTSDSSSRCPGRGPLHMALANGDSVKVVQAMLLQDKTITRHRDANGMTPLHLAMEKGSPVDEAVKAVLKFDPEVVIWQDKSGQTPCKSLLSLIVFGCHQTHYSCFLSSNVRYSALGHDIRSIL